MRIGCLVRSLLGDRAFQPIGKAYRSIFVDLDAVVDAIGILPPNARVLDIGGGDGDVINRLLKRNADCRITMIDLADSVGGWVESCFESRVERMPNTSVIQFSGNRAFRDVVIVSDVIHHVPAGMRESFITDILTVVGPKTILIIKDVNPGGFRSALAYLSDYYITGDKSVKFVHCGVMEEAFARRLPNHILEHSDLEKLDAPNYLFKLVP
jgi:2-polyprenyl-3-methyl-5-hydroxy-6-metoxy-1,4-benzoquinol methylase